METKLEQIAAKAVKQQPKSVVREIRTPRSVGTGGRRLPPVTRCGQQWPSLPESKFTYSAHVADGASVPRANMTDYLSGCRYVIPEMADSLLPGDRASDTRSSSKYRY